MGRCEFIEGCYLNFCLSMYELKIILCYLVIVNLCFDLICNCKLSLFVVFV